MITTSEIAVTITIWVLTAAGAFFAAAPLGGAETGGARTFGRRGPATDYLIFLLKESMALSPTKLTVILLPTFPHVQHLQ